MQTGLNPYVIVLGIAQDGGVPHCGCSKQCCSSAWKQPQNRVMAACLGIVDLDSKQKWMIEATPDFKYQLHTLNNHCHFQSSKPVDGIFLTHGHVGHYAGLIHLDKAIMNTKEIPVFAMSKMKQLLTSNLPWKGMCDQKNISLHDLQSRVSRKLSDSITIRPFLVPHRDEYTETVGFQIIGPNKTILFIPDIDRWESFPEIDQLIQDSDTILLDGTFYDSTELSNRNMQYVPHPTIESSLSRFQNIPMEKKNHFFFIHLNHTNPCLSSTKGEYKNVIENHFHIAREEQILPL